MPQLSLHSPVGDLSISEDDGAVVAVDWGWGRDQTPTALLKEASKQLNAYFDGKVTGELRSAFSAMKAASLLREALWAMVSDVHLKTPGVDYQAHAREYLKRLESCEV